MLFDLAQSCERSAADKLEYSANGLVNADPENSHLRAYAALRGASLTWRADLAKAITSKSPMLPMLRESLAEAVRNETESGPRLDLRNVKKLTDHHRSIAACFEWMEIGRWIQARRDEGCSSDNALERAEDRFNAGQKKCENALAYYRAANAWIERVMQDENFAFLGREMLEGIYHQAGTDKSRPKGERDAIFAALNADLLKALGLSD